MFSKGTSLNVFRAFLLPPSFNLKKLLSTTPLGLPHTRRRPSTIIASSASTQGGVVIKYQRLIKHIYTDGYNNALRSTSIEQKKEYV